MCFRAVDFLSGQNDHAVPVTGMADCLAIDAFATSNPWLKAACKL